MKRALTVLLAGVAALAATNLSAQNIAAGSASGPTTGGATTPATVPVTFTRNAAIPVADFTVRVNYSNTNFTAVAAGANGGSCAANQALGAVVVNPPPGGTDTPTNVYCNITFTINAGVAVGNYPLTPTVSFAGGGCFDAAANPVVCTLTAGQITVTGGVVNTPPAIAYNPAAGSTINYTGGGTASAIVATPSGGSGSGAAATTTVGACTITGGGAAFPTTNIAQLSFVGNTVTPQNINLPNCVPQAAAVNATLTCPESAGGAAAVNRVWTLTCPAAAVMATPPTITYNPVAGSTTNVAAGANTVISVGCPTDGAACNGSGTGLAATSRLESLTATFAGAASPQPIMTCAFITEGGVALGGTTLDYVATQADPGDIRCTCPVNTTSLPEPFTVSVQERIPASGGITATRTFNLVCGAPPPNCGSIVAANQAPGSIIALTNGGAATQVTALSLVGASSGVSQTTTCVVSGASAGSTFNVTTAPTPLVLSTNPALSGTVSATCTNAETTTATATVTCSFASNNSAVCANGTPVQFTLSCPGAGGPPPPPPPGEFIPVPTLSEQGRILLAALVLLMGLGVVGFRMRG